MIESQVGGLFGGPGGNPLGLGSKLGWMAAAGSIGLGLFMNHMMNRYEEIAGLHVGPLKANIERQVTGSRWRGKLTWGSRRILVAATFPDGDEHDRLFEVATWSGVLMLVLAHRSLTLWIHDAAALHVERGGSGLVLLPNGIDIEDSRLKGWI